MSRKIVWDKSGEKLYETGVDRGVVYTTRPTGNDAAKYNFTGGVAWNGLTNVSENPSGAEANALYADNIKYLNLISREDFGASIEAYMYPEEFALCDGSSAIATGVYVGQQTRKQFGFCYRTLIGNDTEGDAHGYKLHLVYNCLAAPSEKAYPTVGDSPDAITMSWEVSTTPVSFDDGGTQKFTASLVIDSTKVDSEKLGDLEEVLYGTAAEGSTEAVDAKLPLPDEVVSILG